MGICETFPPNLVLLSTMGVIFGESPSRNSPLHRKEAVIKVHPLFGRVICREELPALARIVYAAWRLPAGTDFGVAYLIQGEEDVRDKEYVMWQNNSDTFVLTFRTQRYDALFFPNSVLAEGRNVLLAAAAIQELRKGCRYTYYVFLDGDVVASQPWSHALPQFESFLRNYEPAVGLPSYSNVLKQVGYQGQEPHSIFHFDHIFVAVHADAAPALLPYQTDKDKNCAWVSQWTFTLLANSLFMNHTLMLPTVQVHNPSHGEYPRADCAVYMASASAELRAAVAPVARECFPNPTSRGFVFAHGRLGPTSYLPWGTAMRKRSDDHDVDYSLITLTGLTTSCGSFARNAQARSSPRVSRICAGCPMEIVFYMVQVETAKNPLWPPNWLELGVNIWGIIGDIPIAAACVSIARRLVELRGELPVGEVEEVAEVLHYELGAKGLAPLADELFRTSSIWSEARGIAILGRTLRVSLTSHHEADHANPFLMSEERTRWFIKILTNDRTAQIDRPPFELPLAYSK